MCARRINGDAAWAILTNADRADRSSASRYYSDRATARITGVYDGGEYQCLVASLVGRVNYYPRVGGARVPNTLAAAAARINATDSSTTKGRNRLVGGPNRIHRAVLLSESGSTCQGGNRSVGNAGRQEKAGDYEG